MESVDTKVEVHYNDGGVRHGEDSLRAVFERAPRGSGETCDGERVQRTGSRAKIVDPHVNGAELGEAV